MASPRKHWFKCPDSVADEDWDNDQLATLIRLQARLNTRWARNGLTGEDAGRISLSAGDAMAVTRRSSFARASSLLRSCTACVSMTVRVERASVKIDWPKWPAFQGLTATDAPESSPSVSRESPSPRLRRKTHTQDAIRDGVETPAPRARRARPKTPCPDALDPEAWNGIAAWAAKNQIAWERLGPEWEAMRDHWLGKDELRADWSASFRTWLRNAKRFAARDAQRDGSLSPAQARAERTKDAGRQAYELLQQRKLGLISGGAA